MIFQDSKTDYDGGTGFEQGAENQDYEEETYESEAQRRWIEEKDCCLLLPLETLM
jgi:hypothetical protein